MASADRHSLPGRLEKKGEVTAPPHQETTNRYDENDGVSTLVHELAFGIDICFGRHGLRSPVRRPVQRSGGPERGGAGPQRPAPNYSATFSRQCASSSISSSRNHSSSAAVRPPARQRISLRVILFES